MLKAQSNLSETTERAAALLQELRLRLNTEAPRQQINTQETADELDRELQAYFSVATNSPPASRNVLNEIRDRVVEGVVDRIMRAWEEPAGPSMGAIEQAVMERLIERVLERLGNESTGSRQSERAGVPRFPGQP